jgi:hypothetical protein
MVHFPEELKNVPVTPAGMKAPHPATSPAISAPTIKEDLPKSPEHNSDHTPTNKLSLQHIMSMMKLGDSMNKLEEMRVWEIGQLPPGKKKLNSWWFFATKPDFSEGVHYKARFVAKGFTQVAGVDFNATFTPTDTFISLRLLLNIAAANQWPAHSFAFVDAYLNSPIDEEI